MTEAYAWSFLAAEGGVDEMVERRDLLLPQINDQAKAEERAAKLQKKYGKMVLEERAKRLERKKLNNQSSVCTGTRIGCS